MIVLSEVFLPISSPKLKSCLVRGYEMMMLVKPHYPVLDWW